MLDSSITYFAVWNYISRYECILFQVDMRYSNHKKTMYYSTAGVAAIMTSQTGHRVHSGNVQQD